MGGLAADKDACFSEKNRFSNFGKGNVSKSLKINKCLSYNIGKMQDTTWFMPNGKLK